MADGVWERHRKKDGKDFAFPHERLADRRKNGGEWKIAAMHFSTLTGAGGSEAKGTD
jgi:hypothetical protein